MRKLWALIAATLVTVSLVVGPGVREAAAATCQPFRDVTSANSACANIAWLKDQRITKPTDGLYHPTAPVNRGAMTAFLYRLTHPNAPSPACIPGSFPDVTSADVFCGYIGWAAETGVAQGYSDGTFGSDKSVTRGAMAAFIRRIAAPGSAPKCTTKPYDDVAEGSQFCGVITWMKAAKITYGIAGTKNYGTALPVSRQAMASFLHRTATYLAAHQATGPELPGGGRTLFPDRRLVGFYGSPFSSTAGTPGARGIAGSIAYAKKLAAPYQKLSPVPVVPALELVTTQATTDPGADGNYSLERSVAALRPWVTAAGKAGVYVILDLQPGRANLLEQAKRYESLLTLPHVGLAIDPEWAVGPGQVPGDLVGHVEAADINAVTRWLSALTTAHQLPQKILAVQQFRPGMIRHESTLSVGTSHVRVTIQMDGHGTPFFKNQTWDTVVSAAPEGMAFGWVNFLSRDNPPQTPAQTMAHTPRPNLITFQ